MFGNKFQEIRLVCQKSGVWNNLNVNKAISCDVL